MMQNSRRGSNRRHLIGDNLGIRIGADEFLQLQIARVATRDSTHESLLNACDCD